jgi:AcrR family transcriptional regulator
VTVDQIVVTGIAVADDDGLDALSMRAVAERLGVGAMTLYSHVASKSQLIELMVDQVTAELPTQVDAALGWRGNLERMARLELEHLLRHPWLLQVDPSLVPLGPGISYRYEYQLRCIEGTGLGDLDMDAVIGLLASLVSGAARSLLATVKRTAVQSDVEWWNTIAPILEQVIPAGDFPVSGRVGTTVGEAYGLGDPAVAFEFGLGRVLDGIEVHIARVNAAKA